MTSTPESTEGGSPAGQADDPPPPESEIDRLVDAISGEDDHVGMAALWRVTMDLDQWWFIAVGEPGEESPAAADIDDQLMLLAFTDGARARHFAVAQGMIARDDHLSAIALRPDEVVATSRDYVDAGIDGLMFDPHISGYFIASDQLPVVHAAVRQPAS
ncbi:MAG TPA: hypothetical protein VJ976_09250 [Ornithinimicrobium sp.]|uniref:hypothetical protein n=1 Tax=Ornithinimicrobium sp. TaxID=1977084 RepID=UPI002B46FA17|nr:hypothetical protein [Ornithinimicrobium sp.]HKJ12553.1 hypothetical protein [Ornithinimicrobium sp.]